jgi:hypothetical protein
LFYYLFATSYRRSRPLSFIHLRASVKILSQLFFSAFFNEIEGFFVTEQTSSGLKAVADSSQSGSLMSTIGKEKSELILYGLE